MQIAILGPLEVRDDEGRIVDIAGARVRTLLTRLAIDAGRPVRVAALVDTVWGDQPPIEETNALQTLVSRLRRALGGAATIGQSPSGYRLAAEPPDVDAVRFRQLAADGAAALRRAAHTEALRQLDAALALWRGPALADSRDHAEALDTYARELDDLRLSAVVDRIEARLAVDGGVDLAELERLAADHPLHERLAGLLVRSLAASGRQADALRTYEGLRTRLADELGVDPSAELQELHLTLLRGSEPGDRPARRTNLKAQLTSFVGREDEVARIGKSLEQNRLVTLVGPGGAGKTRLASEAAGQIVDSAPDGIWLVELATVTSGADVPQAVLGSIGLREIHLMERRAQLSARDAVTRLRDALAERRAVLVLDNCEHVVEAGARLAEMLLSDCPGLRVLATSREPLGILGEALLAVPPLGQPAPNATAAEALEYPAVRLFSDRAAAVVPEFAVNDATVGHVVEIVRRLDGLPLAIELAAARLRSLPVDEIASRLSDRFRLLTGGSRTAMPRHRTLRAVVEWSWDLLNDDERRVVENLAVFPAGVAPHSAAAVQPDAATAADIDDVLASLIDKSLLQPVDGGRRMRMLETIREYGAERLSERGELGAARERHARHFAQVLAEAEPHLTTAAQLPWFDILIAERENILAAMRYYCDAGDADAALRIGVSLAGFAMMLGDHAEIGVWMADALSVPGGEDANLRSVARALLTINSAALGDIPEIDGAAADMQAMAEELAHVDFSATPLMALLRPAIAFFAGDAELTRRYSDEAMAADDEWGRAAVRMFLANMAENAGDLEVMRSETETALAEFRRLGERWGLAGTLRGLAQLLVLDGDLDAAEAAYLESLDLMHQMRSTEDEVYIRGRLADIRLRRGDLEAAREHVRRAQDNAAAGGSAAESIFALGLLGGIEFRIGHVDRAREIQREALDRLAAVPREHPAHGHIRAMVLSMSARVEFEGGDIDIARAQTADAFTAAVCTKDLPIIAAVGVVAADITAESGRPTAAARMLGACARLRGAEDHTAVDVRKLTERLTTELGESVFACEHAAGRALDRDAAIAQLRQEMPSPGP